MQLTKQQIQDELWKRGEISWKLHEGQVKINRTVDKSGEIVDLIEKVEIPGDVKAQLAYLQAKDKDGGWDNKSNTVNVHLNQAMQGISTNDLLLTLRSAPEQLSTGGEGGGVLEVSGVREEKLS